MAGKWIQVEPYGIAICVPPKCGTTSIVTALTTEFSGGDADKVTGSMRKMADLHPGVLTLRTPRTVTADIKFAVIRPPTQRFISLYKDKVLGRRGCGRPEVRAAVKACQSPEDLFRVIQTYENSHWTPQCEFIGPYTDVGLVDLAWLNWLWGGMGWNTAPPRLNCTDPQELVYLSNELRTDIQRKYVDDSHALLLSMLPGGMAQTHALVEKAAYRLRG